MCTPPIAPPQRIRSPHPRRRHPLVLIPSLVLLALAACEPASEPLTSAPTAAQRSAGADDTRDPRNYRPEEGFGIMSHGGGAIISNGLIQLGVNPEGHLNVPFPDDTLRIGTMGLRYVPTGAASTEPGCRCEGWGIGDVHTGARGGANVDGGGVVGLEVETFLHDATGAKSVVIAADVFRVTHAYRPSLATAHLYQVDVTIRNISTRPVLPRYRRVMDWDIYPTPFREFVTLQRGTATSIFRTDNNGFNSWDPFSFSSFGLLNVNFTDAGPRDHGALFDFQFAELAPGAEQSFKIYYGAAGTETDAMAALGAVGAEAYSLGQPSTTDGPSQGKPNTFIFAFSGIGGDPVPPDNQPPTAVAGADQVVEVGAPVLLDGSASSDPDDTELTYHWDFGDGFSAPTAVAEHVYTRSGIYTARLTVTDPDGASDSDEATVRVDNVVEVTVTGSPAVAGITVAMTNVGTGSFLLALTNPEGRAKFRLGPTQTGDFVVTARRYSGAHPLDFDQAPPVEGYFVPTGHEGLAPYAGAVYDHGTGGQAALDEVGYCTGVRNPLPQRAGSPRTSISLRLPQVATVNGELLDAEGNPFTLAEREQILSVRPFLAESDPGGCRLPPRSRPSELPRALLIGSVTLPQGSRSAFTLPGASAGLTVVESNRVTLPSGERVVYRAMAEVEPGQTTTETVVGPAPPLAFATYHLAERFGDATGPTDVGGLLTSGWGDAGGGRPNNDFIVSAGLLGLGHYQLELWRQDPRSNPAAEAITVVAACEAKRCKLLSKHPAVPVPVEVSGANAVRKGTARGTVVWRLTLPESEVWFRIVTTAGRGGGNAPLFDTTPIFRAVKRGGGGNSWDASSP